MSLYADVIEEKMRLGGTLAGMLLLATVTSLPELITSTSAILLTSTPNIASGGIMGSSVLNVFLVVLLAAFGKSDEFYRTGNPDRIIAAAASLVMLGIVGLTILVENLYEGRWPMMGSLSLASPLILLLYFLGLYAIRKTPPDTESVPDRGGRGALSLRQAVLRYLLVATVVVSASVWLSFLARDLAEQMQWSGSFTGSTLVALLTGLPEIAVLVSALRMGAVSLGVGNIFGSNMFNMLILAVNDVSYRSGSIFANMAISQTSSGLAAMVMTGTVLAALQINAKEHRSRIYSAVNLLLLLIFLLNLYVLHLANTQ